MKKTTIEEFINEARTVHGDKYGYSRVNYINANTKVCIICPIHGEFWQTPNSHLQGCGCSKCAYNIKRQRKFSNTTQLINKAKRIHGNKYDYSRVEYVDAHTKVCIICPIHGEFWQRPNGHLKGQGCPKCGIMHRSMLKTKTTENFIQHAKLIYGDLYDYSQTKYIRAKVKTKVICKKHGIFMVSPDNHLKGKGCPKCKSSHMENEIRLFLLEKNIKFEEQKRFEWLGKQSLDFYLPQYNIAIECQGEQHFIPKRLFGNEEGLDRIIARDKLKKDKCNQHEISVIYYANYKFNFPYRVVNEKSEILKEIDYFNNKEVKNNGTTNTEEYKGN